MTTINFETKTRKPRPAKKQEFIKEKVIEKE